MIAEQWERCLHMVFPHRCLGCGSVCQTCLCLQCFSKLSPLTLHPLNLAGVDQGFFLLAYEGWVKQALHLIKFNRRKYLARLMGTQLLLSVDLPGDSQTWVASVPLHWTKRWWRGFNQTDALFMPWIKGRGQSLLPLLYRPKRTRALFGLGQAERQHEIKDAFKVHPRWQTALKGRSVLLLDDIVTTGATVSEIARLLKAHGAGSVRVLAVAYTPLKSLPRNS